MIVVNKNFIDLDTVQQMYEFTQQAVTWYWARKFDQEHPQMWLDIGQEYESIVSQLGLNNPKTIISCRRLLQDSGPFKITEGKVCAVMLNTESDFGGGLVIADKKYDNSPGTVIRYENQSQAELGPDKLSIAQTILYAYET